MVGSAGKSTLEGVSDHDATFSFACILKDAEVSRARNQDIKSCQTAKSEPRVTTRSLIFTSAALAHLAK